MAMPALGRYYRLIAALALVLLLAAVAPDGAFAVGRFFLPLHALVEMATVVMAMLVFGVIWHGYGPRSPAALYWLACAFFAAACLDVAHALSYQGMPDFIIPSEPEKAIFFWLTARFAVAATLLAVTFMPASLVPSERLPYRTLAASLLYVVAVYWVVLFHQESLPHVYVPGQGLTPLKIGLEWLIIALLLTTAWRLRRRAGALADYDTSALFAAVLISVLSELSLGLYVTINDVFSLLGHAFKFVAYALVYRAVFVATVKAPYSSLKDRSEELAAAHARFRDLVETSPDWVWEVDANGVYTYASPRVKAMLGYAPEEVLGRTPFDFMPLDEAYRVRLTFESLARMRLPFLALENVNLHKDGHEVVLETSAVPIFGDHGDFLGYRGSDRDITERVRGEDALETERVRMRTLVNTIPDLIWLKDPEGAYLACNPTFERLYGVAEADLVGKTDYDFIARESADGYREADRKAMAASGPSIDEEWVRFADSGRRARLQTIKTPMYDGLGKLIGVLGIARDITSLRDAEDALRKSEENLKLAQSVGHIGSWYLDVRSNTLTWTDENYRIFGVEPAGPMTYEAFLERVHPDDRDAVDRAWGAALKGQPYDIEHRLLVEGEERWVREKAELMFEPNGELIGGIGISQDITERRLADAEREKLERQLRQAQKMEALGQLTGGIAHDFNNILASIMGFSNLALTRFVPDKESKLAQYLGRVVAASERARDLIAKMLAYSRTQSSGEIGDLLPAPVVKEVTHMLAATIPSTIELVAHIDDKTPAIRVNAVELQQVLINLAINARDAIGEIGRIDITLAPATEAGGLCMLCQEAVVGEFVALDVVDTGAGITEENLGRIFDPFFTTKEVGKGSGLGLSMVQGIVKKSRGHIVVHSRPGEGTVFRVLFPLAESKQDETAAPAVDQPASAGKRIIWVVDDEPAVADFFNELLEDKGYRVRVFNKSTDALRAFQDAPSAMDLVISDQTMPGMTGSELAQAMLKERPDLPIFMCSGYSERMDELRALGLGIRRFCGKPVDSELLLSALAEEFAKAPPRP